MFCQHVIGNISGGFRGISRFGGNFAGPRLRELSEALFNKLTFFQADINQSEVEDSFQLASDRIKSAQKNVNKSKAVSLL